MVRTEMRQGSPIPRRPAAICAGILYPALGKARPHHPNARHLLESSSRFLAERNVSVTKKAQDHGNNHQDGTRHVGRFLRKRRGMAQQNSKWSDRDRIYSNRWQIYTETPRIFEKIVSFRPKH